MSATIRPTRAPRVGGAPHRVAVLALDAVVPLDLGIPAQVLGAYDEVPYALTLCGERPGPVATCAGFSVVAEAGLEALGEADTLIVPGFEPHDRPLSSAVLDALRTSPARKVSICTGAFALAAAGVLDGRRATTHWRHTGELTRAYPNVTVAPDVLYVDEGDVLTSAGVAAGLDLCLHILRKDHGAAFAAAVARRIVVPPHRDGGQAQFIRAPLPARDGSLAATRAWALERLHAPLTVKDLAAHACVSERTLARRWTAETGVPVHRWLLAQRVDAARAALETGDATVEEVARATGFGTAANLRKHFRRRVATTPTAYRRAFSLRPRSSGRANQTATSSTAIAAGNA
jgi:transcriptional regulator GlxA family with amidase domain